MNPIDLRDYLSQRPYPGRGILLGRCARNTNAVIPYSILGRSDNTRNPILEPHPDRLRTPA